MDTDDFAFAVRRYVHDGIAESTGEGLINPSGRKPSQNTAELSEWYRNLPESDRAMALKLVARGSHAALFGLLCVLDGVKAIENLPERGTLRLIHESNSGKVVLGDSENCSDLHDAFQATFGNDIP